MKKLIAMLLAVTMLLGLMAGCSNNESKPTEAIPTNGESVVSQPTEAKEPVALTVAYEANPNYPVNAADFEWCNYVAEKLGITIEWLDWGTDEATYAEKLELALAGGNAPDMFMIHGVEKAKSYVADELLLCIEDYWDNYENVKTWNATDDVRDSITYSEDGKIYTTVRQYSADQYWMGLEARMDIIKDNDLSYDGTIEGLTQLMRDMKEASGADYAFTFRHGANYLTGFFAGSFGLGLNALSWNSYDDEYSYHGKDERLLNLLTWLNQLYTEGLLDPEYALNTTDMAVEKMTTGKAVMWIDYFARCNGLTNAVLAEIPDSSYLINPIAMPVTEDGFRPATLATGRIDTQYQWGINVDTENPDACMALLDLIYSDEMLEALNYGVEGTSYTKEADGTKTLIEGVDVNEYSTVQVPFFKTVVDSEVWEHSEYGQYAYEGAQMYKENKWLTEFHAETPLAYFTDDERTELTDCWNDYYEVYTAGIQDFIEGNRALTADEYAKFQNELAEAGGARWCEIQNNAYQAWKKA